MLRLGLDLPSPLVDVIVQEFSEELPVDVDSGIAACADGVDVGMRALVLHDNPLQVQNTSLARYSL